MSHQFFKSPVVIAIVVGISILNLPIAVCAAQTAAGGAGAGPATKPSSVEKPFPAAASQNDDPLALFRAPLLREGSHLNQAKSRMQRDPTTGGFKLIIDSKDPSAPNYELMVLPCTRLTEMSRIIEAASGQDVAFQVSGEVFVFHGRNYILPAHAPVLTEQESATSASQPTGPVTMPAADTAQDIARNLAKAAGPLRHSSAPPSRGGGSIDAKAAASDESGARPAGGTGAGRSEKLLREDTNITNRRGKLMRDGSGGWLFVFDADATGLADPPVRLLPCLLLEKIEEYARRLGNNSPALLSGPIYVHGGQNYLLPMVFRIPQDRKNLTP